MSESEYIDNLEGKVYEARENNSREMRAVVDKYVKELYPYTDWHMDTIFPRICKEFMEEYQPLLDKADNIYNVIKFIEQIEKAEIDY